MADSKNNKVQKVNLKGQGIKDSDNIFQELAQVVDVVEVDLSDNLLTKLPEDISKLKKLQSLDITNNPFANVIIYILIFSLNK